MLQPQLALGTCNTLLMLRSSFCLELATRSWCYGLAFPWNLQRALDAMLLASLGTSNTLLMLRPTFPLGPWNFQAALDAAVIEYRTRAGIRICDCCTLDMCFEGMVWKIRRICRLRSNETFEHLLAKILVMCPFHPAIGHWLWRKFRGAICLNDLWKFQVAHLTYSCPSMPFQAQYTCLYDEFGPRWSINNASSIMQSGWAENSRNISLSKEVGKQSSELRTHRIVRLYIT